MAIAVHPRAWLERRRERREADYWIAHGFESRYPWRVTELTSERERRLCARALHGVIDEVSGNEASRCGADRGVQRSGHTSPASRRSRRGSCDGEPVSAAGMLAVNELLTSPASCLFTEVESVEPLLRRVPREVEGRLMYDLAALAIAAACFAFIFAAAIRPRANLMSAGDAIGLALSVAVFAYLVYALFRGERF